MSASLIRLTDLPDETVLYPGQNYGDTESASMGQTKRDNFYLRVPDLDTWRKQMAKG